MSYKSKEQKEADQAIRNWRRDHLLGIVRWRNVPIPLSIVNSTYDIPHTRYIYRYKDVYVFGVRVARVQY